jgi:hypothetical protein
MAVTRIIFNDRQVALTGTYNLDAKRNSSSICMTRTPGFGNRTKAAPCFKREREACPRRRAAGANHNFVSRPTTGRL